MTGVRIGPEDLVQIDVMDWIERCLPQAYAFHVANERQCSQQTGRKLKLLGVKPGVPDIFVLLPDCRLVMLEVKSSSGRLSPEQLGFASRAKALGHRSFVVRSLSDAVNVFVTQLGLQVREVAAA